ncbi:MAG: 5-formyltetrahydrofolate cyclo-ligase [Omnitrophica WOR_2 bacterium GWC2_45_7]|nr:MAG: 5-formyltetrahydrofolate cyclo-ligase [Omnitrophica WOR_2 bacterium GWC2_45_7]
MSLNTKKELRERILTLLRNQKEEERRVKSQSILNKFAKLPEFEKSLTILFYEPFDGEVDTIEMIKFAKKLGRKIALPKILKDSKIIIPILMNYTERNLEVGPYGIKQPKEKLGKTLHLEKIDMVIVPGVAFDKGNNRLGRGGGYYDRFLKTLPSHTPTLGLAFDFQIVDKLPQLEKHDIPVKRVLSN